MTRSRVELGGRKGFRGSLLHPSDGVHNDLLCISKEVEDSESSQHKEILITPI